MTIGININVFIPAFIRRVNNIRCSLDELETGSFFTFYRDARDRVYLKLVEATQSYVIFDVMINNNIVGSAGFHARDNFIASPVTTNVYDDGLFFGNEDYFFACTCNPEELVFGWINNEIEDEWY